MNARTGRASLVVLGLGLSVPASGTPQTNEGSAVASVQEPAMGDAVLRTTIRIDSKQRGDVLRLHEFMQPETNQYGWNEEGLVLCGTPCTLTVPSGSYSLTLNEHFWFDINATVSSQTLFLVDRNQPMRSTALAMIVAGGIQFGLPFLTHVFIYETQSLYSDVEFIDMLDGTGFVLEMLSAGVLVAGLGLLIGSLGSVDDESSLEYPDAAAQQYVLPPGILPF